MPDPFWDPTSDPFQDPTSDPFWDPTSEPCGAIHTRNADFIARMEYRRNIRRSNNQDFDRILILILFLIWGPIIIAPIWTGNF